MLSHRALLAVTTDIVLFSILDECLEVLLLEGTGGRWRLPGGMATIHEDLETCALRYLEQQTGARNVYLEQLYTFGRPDRDPRQRVVSVAYYALVPPQRLELQAGNGEHELRWFGIAARPPLILDHDEIVAMAHQRLAAKLAYSTIALQFMPEYFTLSALQGVYETILGEPLDKRNFRKRILAMGCVEPTGALSRAGKHRPARLYRAKYPRKIDFTK
jgi:8-oxo-dGTP diphosphatase